MTRPELERRYRRLLALYPRAFRREHEEEMLAVLLAGAGRRRRPSVCDAADLAVNAFRLHLRPRRPRSRAASAAVRLMLAAAALQLLALLALLLTLGDIHAAILARDPGFTAAQWHTVVAARIVPDEIVEPILAAVWVSLAWATGRGLPWTRAGVVTLFAFTTLGLLVALTRGAVVVAPVSMAVGGVLWLTGIATVALLFGAGSASRVGRMPALQP